MKRIDSEEYIILIIVVYFLFIFSYMQLYDFFYRLLAYTSYNFSIKRLVVRMDKVDLQLATALQEDCRQSIAVLADKVALSPSACHRRIKQMEERGIIQGYVAQVDGKKVGCQIEFFVEISLDSQHQDTLKEFEEVVKGVPEILECHLMTGTADYLMRVGVADTAGYEHFHRNHIARLPGVSRIQSSLVLRTVTQWSGYTLHSA